MNPRIPETPPIILPLSECPTSRPLFSVMIPAYNCYVYLKPAMESVLQQDLGKELMQIEVVDDCSTDGDVEALVKEVGKGRISYFKQETNSGSLRNFETCINRAQGQWVHLLHGDDLVKTGFYMEIKNLFDRYPEVGAAFTNHSLIDEQGNEFKTAIPFTNKSGVVTDWLSKIAQGTILQPPAIVVPRKVYEQLGSFYAVTFGEDWEMWVRIASKFEVAYSPKCLASYRVHTNNITSRSFLSGNNIKDLKKVMGIIKSYLPQDQRKELIQKARKNSSWYIASTAHTLLHAYNNPKAALIQANNALLINRDLRTIYLVSTFYLKYFYRLLKTPFTNLK